MNEHRQSQEIPLTTNKLLAVFQRVGRGFPRTTLHSASTDRFLYRTSMVGNFTSTLHFISSRRLSFSMCWIKFSIKRCLSRAPSLVASQLRPTAAHIHHHGPSMR